MLPSVVASELEQVARDALQTAFHPTTPGFKGLIDRFLADRQRLVITLAALTLPPAAAPPPPKTAPGGSDAPSRRHGSGRTRDRR